MQRSWIWMAAVLLLAGCGGSRLPDERVMPTGPTPVMSSTPEPTPTPTPQPEAAATARYRIVFDATWTSATHPQDAPPNPHFSPPIGATHVDGVTFWRDGGLATEGIRGMAELGATATLGDEMRAAIAAGTANQLFIGDGFSSPKAITMEVTVSRDFPLLTLVTMVAPSPDWFAGVSGLRLFENGVWVEDRVVPAGVWDAGTDSADSFVSPDRETIPRQLIKRIVTPPLGSLPLGTFRIARIG
ncbi:MAG: spondin domain-containing protein [Vicinamibacterales bacterium]